MRKISLLAVVLTVLAAVPVSASTSSSDPFPVGACVRSTAVQAKPICVMVDPNN